MGRSPAPYDTGTYQILTVAMPKFILDAVKWLESWRLTGLYWFRSIDLFTAVALTGRQILAIDRLAIIASLRNLAFYRPILFVESSGSTNNKSWWPPLVIYMVYNIYLGYMNVVVIREPDIICFILIFFVLLSKRPTRIRHNTWSNEPLNV